MADMADYARCGAAQETILHVLRDCKPTAKIWKQYIQLDSLTKFFELDLESWVLTNTQGQFWDVINGHEVVSLFVVICWFLWK